MPQLGWGVVMVCSEARSLYFRGGGPTCNAACIDFVRACLLSDEVHGKQGLEVGAVNINGSVRETVEHSKPSKYIGVDIEDGPGVDLCCDIGDLVERFGRDRFDVVLCFEVLEHVRDWRSAIANLKQVLKPNGVLMMTTRSKGFPYHGYPFDFWRYEPSDIEVVFADMTIEALERDPEMPGVFLKARKPERYTEAQLQSYELYSIMRGRRSKRGITKFELAGWRFLRRVLPVRVLDSIKRAILREQAK